ncbi:family 20 glycosylhydrolase [Microbacterium sp.]|uniref:family 20 glycosylhydrolase n=1 Tax=Microbacterium sp. TaxID=51671 RepID=UPI003A93DA19
MAALIPIPTSQKTDAAAPAFSFTEATRLVTLPATRATAELAAAALAPELGRELPIAEPVGRAGDIVLELRDPHHAADAPPEAPSAPESYTLTVTGDAVRIVGADEAGLFYGVQTLVQLVAASGPEKRLEATVIDDRPRFAYRGTMLDLARHFFGVPVIERHIDHAASLKLNHLHLHLSDDQGWRIQLRSRPKLTELASGTAAQGDAGGFLSKDDYAHLVEYAAARHLTVVPEIDAPGHTHAVGLAHPELMEPVVLGDHIDEVVAAFGGGAPTAGVPYTGFAVGFSSLKTRDEATYEFLADVYGELAAMTPGPYLHVGGDEALGTDAADYAEFVNRATRLVANLGKTPIAWHEAGASADLDDDTIGQYWGLTTPGGGADERARAFVRNGSQVILSPADVAYLDMKYDDADPLGLTWADGPTSVEASYAWEPTAIVDGIDEDDILGIEAPLWTETIRTPTDLDTQVFPRLASAAEIAWSPAQGPDRTWASFRARLAGLGPLWSRQGIAFFRSPEIDWADDTRGISR